MKRTAVAGATAILVLALSACGSPAPEPTPSTEAEIAACMEEHGYPIDTPAKDIDGFTMDGLREAAEACGYEADTQ